MLTGALKKVTSGRNLGLEESRDAARDILEGDVGDAEIAGFLIALKMKGESPEEIAGFVMGLMDKVHGIRPRADFLVDTCGTGGDHKGTFNISTTAALLAAGAGASVAKHGNRGISSRCGSADVLKELGVNIELEPLRVRECIERVGIGFLFAPTFHPAMKRVMGVRRSLGVPTVFNLLGPLANPAGARTQVVGVSSAELVDVFAEVLVYLGAERAFVVHGCDGMDEFTLADQSLVAEVRKGDIEKCRLSPEDLGLSRCGPGELTGGDARENASIVKGVLAGEGGPRLDVSAANAAFALVASGRTEGLEDGLRLARESAESGRAGDKLAELVSFSGNGGVEDVPR